MYSRYKGGRCCLVYRQLVEDNLKAIGVVAGKSQAACGAPRRHHVQSGCSFGQVPAALVNQQRICCSLIQQG